jgi:AraC-like DNA-binding protein
VALFSKAIDTTVKLLPHKLLAESRARWKADTMWIAVSGLNWLAQLVSDDYWQTLAWETFQDDLGWQQRALTCNVIPVIDNKTCAQQLGCSISRTHRVFTKHAGSLAARWQVCLSDVLGCVEGAVKSC